MEYIYAYGNSYKLFGALCTFEKTPTPKKASQAPSDDNNKMMNTTQSSSKCIELNDYGDTCLMSIMKDGVIEAFGKLFWTSAGRKWHPLLIKWCLFLHHLSSGAHKLLRNTGCDQLAHHITLITMRGWMIKEGMVFNKTFNTNDKWTNTKYTKGRNETATTIITVMIHDQTI